MAVVITPLGVRCNLQCSYCYEDPLRDAGNSGGRYDIDAIKASIVKEGGGPFLLFGGEPLLLAKEVLQEIWEWGFERYGSNIVQTNGSLIDDDHVHLFRRYNVRVGISIDGPGDLNRARRQGTTGTTDAATLRTEHAIARLCAEGRAPSLIVILHRLNAREEVLPRLIEWFRGLAQLGVRRIGLHLLEIENEAVRRELALSVDENANALLRLRQLRAELPELEFSLLRDIEKLILGDDENANCIWRACDPYTTAAVRGVGGHGERTKCGRVNKDGVDSLRDSREGYERYLALYHTPYEAGGCRGCRFFLMCRGQCPGTAINGDWRNRSEQCALWMKIFEQLEAELIRSGEKPLSLSNQRAVVEREMLRAWEVGKNLTTSSILKGSSGAH